IDEGADRRRIATWVCYGLPFVSAAIFQMPRSWWRDTSVGAGMVVAPELNARAVEHDRLCPLVLDPLAGRVVRCPAAPHVRRQRVRLDDAVVEGLDPVLDRDRLVRSRSVCCCRDVAAGFRRWLRLVRLL